MAHVFGSNNFQVLSAFHGRRGHDAYQLSFPCPTFGMITPFSIAWLAGTSCSATESSRSDTPVLSRNIFQRA